MDRHDFLALIVHNAQGPARRINMLAMRRVFCRSGKVAGFGGEPRPFARAKHGSLPLRLARVALFGWTILFAAALSGRAQTPYAPGGLFVHPTAFIPKAHQFSTYMAVFTQDEGPAENSTYYPLSLTYTPTDRMQVSALATYHQDTDEPSHTHLGAFLKYQILPDTLRTPALAIAGGYSGNDHLESTVSAIVSHRFLSGKRVAVTLHTGVKWGRTSDNEGGMDDVGGFIGAQVPITREWDLVGEASTRLKFDLAAASSIGVMYHTRGGTGISLGLVNSGRSKSPRLFFGVGFPLGH
jgi:hypothetical protein